MVPPHSITDHLIGLREQHLRHLDAAGCCRLEIDDQLKVCRKLHWQLGGLGALEYLVDIGRRAPNDRGEARPIGHENAVRHDLRGPHAYGQSVCGRKLRDLVPPRIEQATSENEEPLDAGVRNYFERLVQLPREDARNSWKASPRSAAAVLASSRYARGIPSDGLMSAPTRDRPGMAWHSPEAAEAVLAALVASSARSRNHAGR